MTDPQQTVVGRWLEAGDAGDFDAFDELMHADAVVHAPAGLSTTSADEEKTVWQEALDVDGLDAALPLRPAEEIALTCDDADAADRRQLLGGLDPLGHDRRLPPGRQFLEGTQDGERRVVEYPTLDQ